MDRVTVDLRPGEVVGLVGGNGAGKSTLMRVLGARPADAGEILIEGKPVSIGNPRDAKALGIETIYQTLALADNVDAAANVFLGRELKTRFGNLEDAAMESATRKVIGRLNPRFRNFKSPVNPVGRTAAVDRHRPRDHFSARVLIMDEPGRLGPAETTGPRARRPAEAGGHRHLPDQPRHPRRVRPVGPDHRHAPGQARRDRQQGRRHQDEVWR